MTVRSKAEVSLTEIEVSETVISEEVTQSKLSWVTPLTSAEKEK